MKYLIYSILFLVMWMSANAQSSEKENNIEEIDVTEIDEIDDLDFSSEDTDDDVKEVFDVAKLAEFKEGGAEGFSRFIVENMAYPDTAKNNDVQGMVHVSFVVDTNGEVIDIQTLGKKLGYGLEEEAMRVIYKSNGRWKPAEMEDGTAVKNEVSYSPSVSVGLIGHKGKNKMILHRTGAFDNTNKGKQYG